MQKPPKDDSRYAWTRHAWDKMREYGISESRIKRIIRFPKRVEEGIAERTIAVMQPSNPVSVSGKEAWRQEIWVMYKLAKGVPRPKTSIKNVDRLDPIGLLPRGGAKIKVITAWRYPGVSPERDPVPAEVIREVQRLL